MEAEKEQPLLPLQPRVPDSCLPGVEALSAGSAHVQSEDHSPVLQDRSQDHGYCSSALALSVGILSTIAILAAIWASVYGPRPVFQVILRFLMPARPQPWHAVAIWGAIVACITCAIPVLLLLLPIPSLIFGFWKGFCITFMGLMCAACLSFFIGRWVARRPVRRYLEGKQLTRIMRILHVMEDTEEQSMRLLILWRFLPIPMGVRNYGPSVLQVPIPKLVLAAIPHSLWSSTVFATAGSALHGTAQLIRDGNEIPWSTPHWQQVLGLVVACLSFLLFTGLAWRAYTQKAEEDEKRQVAAQTTTSVLKGYEEGGSYGTTA